MNRETEQELATAAKVLLARFAPGWRPEINCGYGWYPILIDLDRDLRHIAPDYKIKQIKEKFGGLRYYIEYPEQRGLVGLFEEQNPSPGDPEGLRKWRADFQSFKNSPEGQELLGNIQEQNARIQKRLRQAEADAARTCETCGKPGNISESDWQRVRCYRCLS